MRKSDFILLVSAILLIAVGFLAVLPPFEGFDETAHYSSIQQIADTGTIPRYGLKFLESHSHRLRSTWAVALQFSQATF